MIESRDVGIAKALAYVDDSLPPNDRREFERRMAGDPEISIRVETWLAQNEAIRAAFGEGGLRRNHGRVGVLNLSCRTPDPARAERFIEDLRRGARLTGSPGRAPAAPVSSQPHRRPGLARRLERAGMAILGTLLIFTISLGPGPRERAMHFAGAAMAAYRTYAGDQKQAVELATSEAKTLEQWFKPQFYRPISIPVLSGAGFALVGGRVVPGAEGPAAFAVYKNAEGERVGLVVEPSDSPTIQRPVFETSGDVAAVSFAARAPAALTVVGRNGTSRLAELAGLVEAAAAPPK